MLTKKYLVLAVVEENKLYEIASHELEFRDLIESICRKHHSVYHSRFQFGWVGRLNWRVDKWKTFSFFFHPFTGRQSWHRPFHCHGQSTDAAFARFERNHFRTSYTRRWSDAVDGRGDPSVSGEHSRTEGYGKNESEIFMLTGVGVLRGVQNINLSQGLGFLWPKFERPIFGSACEGVRHKLGRFYCRCRVIHKWRPILRWRWPREEDILNHKQTFSAVWEDARGQKNWLDLNIRGDAQYWFQIFWHCFSR